MAAASFVRQRDDLRLTMQATAIAYQLQQLADGRAGYLNQNSAAAIGDRVGYKTDGQVAVPANSATGQLDGGPVYWDWANGRADYKKSDGRDFYAGRAVGDNLLSSNWTVNLNVDPPYDLGLIRDPYTTAPIGTQALGGFLPPQRNGGALTLLLSATNEAQKCDALGKDGFDLGGACGIVEAAFNVTTGGAASQPIFTLGIASATHATDMTSVAQYLLCRLDGNSTKIQVESGDGTHTQAEIDTTKTFTVGAGNANRVEVWFDLRDLTSVKMYVNGVRVLSGTTFNLSAAAATWKLIAHLVKAAAATQFAVDVEWLRFRKAQQRG